MFLSIFFVFHFCFLAITNAAGAGLRFKVRDHNFPFAEYENWDFSSNGTMSFLFQTHKRTALLLYHDNRRNDKGQDYLEVFIDKGNIRFRFNLNFCKQISELIVTGRDFADYKWHYVVITLDFKYVSISVDNTFISKKVHCKQPEFTHEFAKQRRRKWAPIYLGGIHLPLEKMKYSAWSSVTLLHDATTSR